MERRGRAELERVVRTRERAWRSWNAAAPHRQRDMVAWVEAPRTRLVRWDRRRRLREALENGFSVSLFGSAPGTGG